MALSWVCASSIAGLAAATKAGLRAAQRVILLVVQRRPTSSRSRAAEARLWVASLMFLMVSPSARHDRLVGAELDDLAELLLRGLLDLLHLLGALVQRVLALRGQQRRSLAARLALCADNCRLAARRGMSRRSDRPWSRRDAAAPCRRRPLISDGHAGDHGEGGEQAAPDAPSRTQNPRTEPSLPHADRHAIACPCATLRMNMRSQYRVTRLTKSGIFGGLAQFCAIKTKKGRHDAGPSKALRSIVSRSVAGRDRAAPVEAVVHARLDGMIVGA